MLLARKNDLSKITNKTTSQSKKDSVDEGYVYFIGGGLYVDRKKKRLTIRKCLVLVMRQGGSARTN